MKLKAFMTFTQKEKLIKDIDGGYVIYPSKSIGWVSCEEDYQALKKAYRIGQTLHRVPALDFETFPTDWEKDFENV